MSTIQNAPRINDYLTALRALDGRESRKLWHNTYVERHAADCVGVRYHRTYVVRYWSDGKVQLTTAGWNTSTTKLRLNLFSPARVWQHKHEWFYDRPSLGDDSIHPFEDGMILDLHPAH